jgi:hypothetical protein
MHLHLFISIPDEYKDGNTLYKQNSTATVAEGTRVNSIAHINNIAADTAITISLSGTANLDDFQHLPKSITPTPEMVSLGYFGLGFFINSDFKTEGSEDLILKVGDFSIKLTVVDGFKAGLPLILIQDNY